MQLTATGRWVAQGRNVYKEGVNARGFSSCITETQLVCESIARAEELARDLNSAGARVKEWVSGDGQIFVVEQPNGTPYVRDFDFGYESAISFEETVAFLRVRVD